MTPLERLMTAVCVVLFAAALGYLMHLQAECDHAGGVLVRGAFTYKCLPGFEKGSP